jgi:Ca2+-binding EF-hand superfamily protein
MNAAFAVVDIVVPYSENLHRVFDVLNKKMVDYDRDGRISREEFLQFCETALADKSSPASQTVESLSAALFAIYDQNDTGTLSEAEFLLFARACGLVDAVATAGFNLIDRDRNGRIAKDEWQRFLRGVFLSRKMNDAAAVVFGPGCRDIA